MNAQLAAAPRLLFDAPPTRVSEYPRPSRLLVHISDTHLLADDELLHGAVNSSHHLVEALIELEESGVKPDALIFTGDITDRGQLLSYAKLLDIVGPVTDRLGAQPIWLMGNHDNRQAFRVGLLGEEPVDTPLDAVYDLGGLRVVALDTTVPGRPGSARSTVWVIGDGRATPIDLCVISEPSGHARH